MAGRASLGFHRFMLKDKRTALIAVTLEANRILVRRCAQLTFSRRSVSIVAIRALNEPFLDAMMERLLEISSLFGVAGEAQRSLILDELIFLLGMVHRVAGDTRNTVFVVSRAQEIALFGVGLMASQTTSADIFSPVPLEPEDLAFVAAAFNVR